MAPTHRHPKAGLPPTQGRTLTVPVWRFLLGFGMHQREGQLHRDVAARDAGVKHGAACALQAEQGKFGGGWGGRRAASHISAAGDTTKPGKNLYYPPRSLFTAIVLLA